MITHVPSSSLQENTHRCPVCGTSITPEHSLTLQQNPEVDLLRCRNCHALYASHFPTPEFLKEIYHPRHYQGTIDSNSYISSKCAKIIAARCQFPKNNEIHLLDYGGGQGNLVRSLKNELQSEGHTGKINLWVVDLFQGKDESIKYITPSEFKTLTQSFDCVIASAVLEHLPDMASVLESLYIKLNINGVFYARTPYEEPIARKTKAYKIRWPRHLFDLGPDFWNRWLLSKNIKSDTHNSRPSVVETTYRNAPVRTAIAHVCKMSFYAEECLLKPIFRHKTNIWKFVGGWEILFIKIK